MIKKQIELILSNNENLVGIEDDLPIYTRDTLNKIIAVFADTKYVFREEPWQNNAGAFCFICWNDEENYLECVSFDILY